MRLQRGIDKRGWCWLIALVAFAVPSITAGDVLRLKDGSDIKGRTIRFVNDTLTFETTFGAEIKVPRSRILALLLSDTVTMSGVSVEVSAPVPSSPKPEGHGGMAVTFRDRKLSSKIKIYKKKDWDGHVRANWIVQELLVDGKVVFSHIDSTMDKTIYQGKTKTLKNDYKLKDIDVTIPSGAHNCIVIVRNFGAVDYEDKFDDRPLNLELHFDNLVILPEQTSRAHIGISRGKLRAGQPRLYLVE